ncbi:MAG: thiamine phosphate synthase [Planctomycetota bacterium]
MPDRTEALARLAVTPDRGPGDDARLVAETEAALLAGATGIVFREKSLDDPAFVRRATALRSVAAARGAWFILNERLEAADALRPDAFWATFRSPDLGALRARLGEAIPIGRSVHGVEEGLGRAREGYDFLVLGPVRATPSKEGLVSPLGWEAVGELSRAVDVPVVAIGGSLARGRRARAGRGGDRRGLDPRLVSRRAARGIARTRRGGPP